VVDGTPAEPALVGRVNEGNVVLADLDVARRRAVLDVPTTHPSLYDHPLDNVPTMALIESARQLVVAVTGRQPVEMDAKFLRFVELDQPAEVTAEPDGDHLLVRIVQDGAPSAGRPGGYRVRPWLLPLGEVLDACGLVHDEEWVAPPGVRHLRRRSVRLPIRRVLEPAVGAGVAPRPVFFRPLAWRRIPGMRN
jgi:hypothetical protein